MQYFRPRFDFLRGAFVHNMAVVDDVGAIGERECRCQVLLHQQDRLPAAASLRQASTRSRTITGARPSNGSSSRMIFGSRISARAIASICCSPPDRSVPRLHRFGPYCTMPYTGSIGSVVGFVCCFLIDHQHVRRWLLDRARLSERHVRHALRRRDSRHVAHVAELKNHFIDAIHGRSATLYPRFNSLKKSLPLSSMTMKAGKFSTSIFQIASMPSSGYS